MGKKLVLALLMAALLAGGAFAQNFRLSAGGGISIIPSFGETIYDGKAQDGSKTTGFDLGINAFFDATYAEINIGLLLGNQKWSEDDDKGFYTATLLLGVVGKYPFSLSDKFMLFPFLGIDYSINLAANRDGGVIEDSDYWFNALSILFGVGADFSLTNALYLRGELGYGIILNTKAEADTVNDDDKYAFFKGKIPIKIAVGYRFK
jgi:hypothetical protein